MSSAEALRSDCESLPEINLNAHCRQCATALDAELLAERCHTVYSYLAFAYLHSHSSSHAAAQQQQRRLPRNLAVPWHAAAVAVGRAPSLDYVATVLANGNPTVTFTGLDDERFFYALHVRIEKAAAPAVGALVRAVDAAAKTAAPARGQSLPPDDLARCLTDIAKGVEAMAALLPEMSAGCAPAAFHAAIRGALSGFNGRVLFEGVGSYASPATFQLTGASGAQSAVLPCVDAFMGIGHTGAHEPSGWSVDQGSGGLSHLPPPHRRLLHTLRKLAPAAHIERTLAALDAAGAEREARALRAAHTACVQALISFRKAHFALVRAYIIKPAKLQGFDGDDSGRDSPTSVAAPLQGTGGSELGRFLMGRLLDTARASLAHACLGHSYLARRAIRSPARRETTAAA